MRITKEEGFELHATETLKNIKRTHDNRGTNGKCVKMNRDEQILVFRKGK